MSTRQPIVSVLGHVDHGKSTILDKIRGTNVVAREAGGITQHIGATEVPLETIYELCGDMAKGKSFSVPGLLFIDTPGHHSFITLRSRGGALADLAVLVIDVNQGIQPQTIESMKILKKYKTPFIIAANKIDLLEGWRAHKEQPFVLTVRNQPESTVAKLDQIIYDLVGKLYEYGIGADRFDKIEDFTKTVAIIPLSGKTGEGIPDLLLVLVGLAQRFLEDQLESEQEEAAEGTVLELKEEKGLGTTLDVIIYKGEIKKGDSVAISSTDPSKPIITKIKALLKPKPLDEIRDPTQRFDSVKTITAAAGIKIAAQNLETALAGGLIKVIRGDQEKVVEEIRKESEVNIELAADGIIAKADAIGSIEALAFEMKNAEMPIRTARIGKISKKDLVEAETATDPTHRIILAFNVDMTPEAQAELKDHDVTVLSNNVVYRLIEDYQVWKKKKKEEIEGQKRMEIIFPGKIKLLPNCVFRVSKPAIVGVRVLAGRIMSGQALIKSDGKMIGKIRSIQSGNQSQPVALMGQEVAISIDDVTVGRQLKVEDILYIDIPEGDARKLQKMDLRSDEVEVMQEVMQIKRKEEPFWAM
ncbi:MAG: translation initiation factor IF-2 [Thermoplasmata archaeon]|nr:translation initiation factor IF-2 [Thermoplasmata archaeon]